MALMKKVFAHYQYPTFLFTKLYAAEEKLYANYKNKPITDI